MTTTLKKPNAGLNLTKLSAVAQIAVNPNADAEVPIDQIDIQRQVRTKLGNLEELAASISAMGVLEPILLVELDGGRYRLIAGERRLRASQLVGLKTIPARVKRNLTEFEIRQMQITENNDRENLSAYDEAMGVIQDVEAFGVQKARQIWNRSDAWISKRMAVKKYAQPVRELLEADLCGDLETLHSLNQLRGLAADEFEALVARMRSGAIVSRDDARSKVSAVKTWHSQQEAAAPPVKGPTSTTEDAPDDAGPAAAGGADAGGDDSSDEAAGAPVKPKSPVGKKAEQRGPKGPGAEEQRVAAELNRLRAEMMEWGRVSGAQLDAMTTSMQALGYPLAEGEWVLWTAFLDSTLPMLKGLGKDRAASYLRRVLQELKSQDAGDWWRELHPVVLGESEDDANATREPIAPMPPGWTF